MIVDESNIIKKLANFQVSPELSNDSFSGNTDPFQTPIKPTKSARKKPPAKPTTRKQTKKQLFSNLNSCKMEMIFDQNIKTPKLSSKSSKRTPIIVLKNKF